MPKKELFPDLKELFVYSQRRGHVLDRLEAMAEAGELFLTECLQQPEEIATMVREVLHGTDRHDKQPRLGRPIPFVLRSYVAKFRIIPHTVSRAEYVLGRSVPRYATYEHGTDVGPSFRLPDIELDSLTESDARALGYGGQIRTHSTAGARERNIVMIETELFELPLHEAVFCLDQCGKNVARARGEKAQSTKWKVEELHPSGVQPDEKKAKRKRRRVAKSSVPVAEKRGPGRPKKAADVKA